MVNVFLRNTDGESLEVVGFTNGTGGLVVSGTDIEGVNVRAEYGCSIVKERNKNDGSETTPHFLWNDLHDSHGGGVLIRDVEPGATYIVIGSPVIVPGEYSSDFGSRRYEGIITHKHPLTHAHVLSHPNTQKPLYTYSFLHPLQVFSTMNCSSFSTTTVQILVLHRDK